MTRGRWQKQPPRLRPGELCWVAWVDGDEGWQVDVNPYAAPPFPGPDIRYWSVPVTPPPFLPGARPKVRT